MHECLHGKDKAGNDAKNDVIRELNLHVTRQSNVYAVCSF